MTREINGTMGNGLFGVQKIHLRCAPCGLPLGSVDDGDHLRGLAEVSQAFEITDLWSWPREHKGANCWFLIIFSLLGLKIDP